MNLARRLVVRVFGIGALLGLSALARVACRAFEAGDAEKHSVMFDNSTRVPVTIREGERSFKVEPESGMRAEVQPGVHHFAIEGPSAREVTITVPMDLVQGHGSRTLVNLGGKGDYAIVTCEESGPCPNLASAKRFSVSAEVTRVPDEVTSGCIDQMFFSTDATVMSMACGSSKVRLCRLDSATQKLGCPVYDPKAPAHKTVVVLP